MAKIVLTTVAEALAKAAANLLGVEETDIGAEYRVAMTSGGPTGEQVEVYLYDLTPGGAGFVRTAAHGGRALFEAALKKLESCTCTHSCYQCLRSYKNKWDHKYLDRGLAASFIRHVVSGKCPTINGDDERRLLRTLAADLRESGHSVEELEGGLRLTDRGRIVLLGHALIPNKPGSENGAELVASGECTVVNQLLVDHALPAAVREATGGHAVVEGGASLPQFLPEKVGGCAVYKASLLGQGKLPPPLATVAIQDAPEDAFVVQLTRPTIERMHNGVFSKGSWVLFMPTRDDAFATDRHDSPRILVGRHAFNATGEHWTFGLPIVRGDKVHIVYRSRVAPLAEDPRRSEVSVLGRAVGVFVNGVLQPIGGN